MSRVRMIAGCENDREGVKYVARPQDSRVWKRPRTGKICHATAGALGLETSDKG